MCVYSHLFRLQQEPEKNFNQTMKLLHKVKTTGLLVNEDAEKLCDVTLWPNRALSHDPPRAARLLTDKLTTNPFSQVCETWETLTNIHNTLTEELVVDHLQDYRSCSCEQESICGGKTSVFTCSLNLFRFWKSVLTESWTTSFVKWSCIFVFNGVFRKTLHSSSEAPFTSGFCSAHAHRAAAPVTEDEGINRVWITPQWQIIATKTRQCEMITSNLNYFTDQ